MLFPPISEHFKASHITLGGIWEGIGKRKENIKKGLRRGSLAMAGGWLPGRAQSWLKTWDSSIYLLVGQDPCQWASRNQ